MNGSGTPLDLTNGLASHSAARMTKRSFVVPSERSESRDLLIKIKNTLKYEQNTETDNPASIGGSASRLLRSAATVSHRLG